MSMPAAVMETGQYLTLQLQEEMFALNISSVRELLDFRAVTRVPRTPDFMLGVINLRGAVVPVVDMRLKLGMTRTESAVNTCIIIVEIEVDGETTVLGVLADSVQEVVEMSSEEIVPPPRLGSRIKTSFISGMAKRDQGFVIILDIDQVFSSDEIAAVRDAGPGSLSEG